MKEIFNYIKSDYYRYTGKRGGVLAIIFYLLVGRNHCFRYSFWFRMASGNSLFLPLAILKHRHLSIKYGIQIPRKTKIGYGFYIGHGVGVVINGGTIIGNNVDISQFLSIGTNKRTPAIIGDNVYIGPNVCIVEDVQIGNDVTIGAGAVVVKDIPSGVTVAGVPAKIISNNDNSKYIQYKYKIHN